MARTTPTRERVRDRALELGVYLPLGAYSRLRDELVDLDLPNIDRKRINRLFNDLIERGQDRVEPVESMLRRRQRQVTRETNKRVEAATRQAKKTTRKTSKRATAAASTLAPRMPRVAAPRSASQLPIKGYNNQTASEIVAQLRGLTQTDLAKIYKWERAHENRSTILEAVESKFVELPIPTYDALNADEINTRLETLSQDELKTIRRYESDTRARATVIDKIDSLLG